MNEWISVKDKLPEMVAESGGLEWSKKVMCFLTDGNIVLAYRLNIKSWKDWDNGLEISSENVTHWMPLPEVP